MQVVTARPVFWTALMLAVLLGTFTIFVDTLDRIADRRYRSGYEAGYSAGLRAMPQMETRVIRGPTGPAWVILETCTTPRPKGTYLP